LRAVDEGAGAGFVDETGDAAGELKDIVERVVGENILAAVGVGQMGFDVRKRRSTCT